MDHLCSQSAFLVPDFEDETAIYEQMLYAIVSELQVKARCCVDSLSNWDPETILIRR